MTYPCGVVNTKYPVWVIDGLQSAIKELRNTVGDTQQAFAHRLGLAISTVVRYEHSRVPTAKVLTEFLRLAHSHGREDLASVFDAQLRELIGVPRSDNRVDAAKELRLVADDLLGLRNSIGQADRRRFDSAISRISSVIQQIDPLGDAVSSRKAKAGGVKKSRKRVE